MDCRTAQDIYLVTITSADFNAYSLSYIQLIKDSLGSVIYAGIFFLQIVLFNHFFTFNSDYLQDLWSEMAV